jgi:N-acetyl sugar amidotransferase
MTKPYQICTRCVMDTSDPAIEFDSNGVCNHCRQFDRVLRPHWKPHHQGAIELHQKIDAIKQQQKNKRYDCVVGLSGGVDSSYVLYLAKEKYGLRPLAFHLDAGWNSDEAVSNIEQLVKRLDVDLYTHVLDWPSMRDLQRSFVLSGLANLDAPQDHAISSSLFQYAVKHDVPYVLSGTNIASEGILPKSWGYDAMDWTLIRDVHRRFGTQKLKRFPHTTWFRRFVLNRYISPLKIVSPLNYFDYNKEHAKAFMIDQLGWKDYGGKHHESRFTKFFQTYYLPTKFGYDKRRAHLASQIVANHLSRDAALEQLQSPPYSDNIEQDKIYFAKKLGFTVAELDRLIATPGKTHGDYRNSQDFTAQMRHTWRRLRRKGVSA